MTFLVLVYELEIWARNSVDRGKGIRHPSSPVVLVRSLLLTYTYFNMFLDNLCLRPWFTYFLIVELLLFLSRMHNCIIDLDILET
uniref:Uncharacterized protein n=1 Tax=Solanum tuberosum TaxID=4113 RepID=M1BFA9_SOLTU